MTSKAEILWWYGYRDKPDGRVCVSEPFADPAHAKCERDRLRAPDMSVTSRFTAGTKEQALKEAQRRLGE